MRNCRKRKLESATPESVTTSGYFTDDSTTSSNNTYIIGPRVGESFYDQPCEDLAKSLLGKVLARKLKDGSILRGIIVETESYLGGADLASKSAGGKVTPGNKPMFMSPGTAYVYFTYGMYYCFNISSQGEGAAVLLRALQPVEGIEEMQINRKLFTENMQAKRKTKCGINRDITRIKPEYQMKKLNELCNGPAKLCISFDIDIQNCNECNMVESDSLWIEESHGEDSIDLVSAPRIGIDSAGPIWAGKLLRFYIRGNKFVSQRDKAREKK